MTRSEILRAAEVCVCGQREEDYGTPEDSFRVIGETRGRRFASCRRMWRRYWRC